VLPLYLVLNYLRHPDVVDHLDQLEDAQRTQRTEHGEGGRVRLLARARLKQREEGEGRRGDGIHAEPALNVARGDQPRVAHEGIGVRALNVEACAELVASKGPGSYLSLWNRAASF
jgi:hypothetical protein